MYKRGIDHPGLIVVLTALAALLVACGGDSDVPGERGEISAVFSNSYYPTSADSGSLSLLEWRYAFTNGDLTQTDDQGVTVEVSLGVMDISMPATLPGIREFAYSGPITLTGFGETESGSYRTTVRETVSDSGDQRVTSGLSLNTVVAVAEFETEVDLNIEYSEPVTLFIDRTDLSDRVGEMFDQQISAVSSGTIIEREVGFEDDVSLFDVPVAAAPATYTIMEAIPSLTVRGNTYADIVVVNYEYDQIDPQTGEPTRATTIYYLARGIGVVRGENLTTLYGTQLNWELVSTNLTQ